MRIDFSSRYRRSLLIGAAWVLLLGFLAGQALDMGQCLWVWQWSLAPYLCLLALVLWRRPKQPTRADLLLMTWGFPLLYLAFFVVWFGPWSAYSAR